jgi:hypothetical protein
MMTVSVLCLTIWSWPERSDSEDGEARNPEISSMDVAVASPDAALAFACVGCRLNTAVMEVLAYLSTKADC